MPQHVRIADRFKTQSAEQLVTMAGAVITGLTNNPAFPKIHIGYRLRGIRE